MSLVEKINTRLVQLTGRGAKPNLPFHFPGEDPTTGKSSRVTFNINPVDGRLLRHVLASQQTAWDTAEDLNRTVWYWGWMRLCEFIEGGYALEDKLKLLGVMYEVQEDKKRLERVAGDLEIMLYDDISNNRLLDARAKLVLFLNSLHTYDNHKLSGQLVEQLRRRMLDKFQLNLLESGEDLLPEAGPVMNQLGDAVAVSNVEIIDDDEGEEDEHE